jgi:hypothetical protein
VGATEADIFDVNVKIDRWNHGGVWIELLPGRRNQLRIERPWSERARLAG